MGTSTMVERPHALAAEAVLAGLGSTPDGLSGAEAAARAVRDGPNALPEPRPDPVILRFGRHFADILIYILLAAGALKAALGEWVDFGVILGVAVVNAAVGFIQEGRATRALAGIRAMLSSDAEVRRDGVWTHVEAQALVVGDIVRVGPGGRVPADLRVIEASNLRVEEAALTGESVPSSKGPDPVAPDAAVGDRASMLYSSSIVSGGSGVGVVVATGQRAEIGRIQAMLSDVDDLSTPLSRQLARFGTQLALMIAAMAVVMAVIGKLGHRMPFNDLTSAVIAFAVSAVPEGLPALVTITLALGVRQMARRQAIVRRLGAVETLGAVTRICSDKTGTLTSGEMTVRRVVTREGVYEVSGSGYAPTGGITRDGAPAGPDDHPDLAVFVEVSGAPINAVVAPSDGGVWTLVGEPTEGALRCLGLKAGWDDASYPRLAALPFDSAHKYSASLNELPDGTRLVCVVGAPDRLLGRCAAAGDEIAWWEAQIEAQSGRGLRVLGAAFATARPDEPTIDHDDLTGLSFAGLAAIADPPRPEAVTAIATCHSAGIGVTMITGDHAGTAQAVAAEMGIIAGEEASSVVTGAAIESASESALRRLVARARVFARTSPEHKLRLVRALQAGGEVVAMTGDGVNDAPALKQAEVGVAMGIKGTEATKQAADIVLADDNFATIEYAVEEGRRIHDNLHKSVLFLLPTNGAQALVVLAAIVFGWTLPLSPLQILWVNLVTAVTLSLSLAYEPAEPDIMTRPPRPAGAPLVGRADVARIALPSLAIAGVTLAAFWWARAHGFAVPQAQTWAVTTLTLAQGAYLFNARFLRESSLRREALVGNRVVWVSVGVLVLAQAGFVYLPFMQAAFSSAAPGVLGWVVPVGLGVVVFAVLEGVKAVLNRWWPLPA